jgi:hypothetical protein
MVLLRVPKVRYELGPSSPSQSSYHQVPDYQKQAQPAGRKKGIPRRTRSLSRLLELLIAPSDILGRIERVRHELVDVRRLRGKIIDEQRLQLRYLDQRLLSRPAEDPSARHLFSRGSNMGEFALT